MGSRGLLKVVSSWQNVARSMSSNSRPVQEVRIPISGGHVAGKWWGPEDKRPIVTLHGWQDNCGSFDRLVPKLPEDIPILAIDSLGHGFSSQIPPGSAYHNIDSVIVLKQLKNYFGWDKLTLMGHSMGAIISYTYGMLFPKEVDFIMCIDGLHPLINKKKMERVAKSIEQQIKYDALNNSKREPPSYHFEEMVKKMHVGTANSIALDTAKYILYRNIAPSKKHPGKFYFNRDARLKVGPLNSPDPEELIRMAGKVTFPLYVSKAAESPFFGNETIFNRVKEVLKTSSSDYQYHDVPGSHHGHLNDPECVSNLLTAFIRKHDIGSRSGAGLKDEVKIDESFYPMFKYKNEILGE